MAATSVAEVEDLLVHRPSWDFTRPFTAAKLAPMLRPR